MAVKTAYTKLHDSEMVWQVNMVLTGATVKAFAKDSTGTIVQLPCVITDGPTGRVTIETSTLAIGKYGLEVEVTMGGKIATFPDSGYMSLTVVEDLG